MPSKYYKWKLAFETGWSLEYIGGLKYSEIFEYIQIKDAQMKAGVR